MKGDNKVVIWWYWSKILENEDKNMNSYVTNKNSCIMYIIGIAVFSIAAVWCYYGGVGVFPVETSIARFFIVLCGAIILHFVFIVKKVRIKLNKVLICTVMAIITIAVSYLITWILFKVHAYNSFSNHIVFFTFSILIISGLFVVYLKKRISDNFFLAVVIFVIGTLYAVSYPITTNISWDDQIHYRRALQVSHANSTEYSEADVLLYNAPFNNYGADSLFKSHTAGEFKNKVNDVYNSEKKIIDDYCSMQLGVLISYIPSAITLFLGRAFPLSYSTIFIMGRWINVLIYSILVYLSLSQIQSGKLIVFTVSMFPTTLFLMSNYNYDSLGLGFIIMAFSKYLGICQVDGRYMTKKDLIAILLCFIMGTSAKPIYFCLVLSILFLDKNKVEPKLSYKKYCVYTIAVCCLIAASFVLPFLISGSGGNDMRGGTEVDSMGQIMFILGNPFEYVSILFSFLKYYWSVNAASGYVSFLAYLGTLSYFLPFFVFCIIVVFLDKSECDVMITNAKNRIWTLLLCFMSSVLVATALYVAFTPVGSVDILGCQQRYLLPLIIFVGYYIGDYRIVAPIRKHIGSKTLYVSSFLVMSLYAIYGIYTHCIALY